MLKLIKTSKIVVTIEPDKKEAFIKTALHFGLDKLADFVRQDESHEISMSEIWVGGTMASSALLLVKHKESTFVEQVFEG